MAEVREAVKILLDRMETHPEEFYGSESGSHHSRFGWVWNVVNGQRDFSYGLTDAEITAIKQGYDKLMYSKFHDRVLACLLNDKDEPLSFKSLMQQQGSSLKHKPNYSDPRGVYGNSTP